MRYPKRSQYKYAKSHYRVLNWAEYETGLQRRGALTVWLSDAALEAWRAPATGRPGGQTIYSDLAIEAALTIRMIFHLPLGQTEGFLRSLASLLGLGLPIPDHTTLSRRLRKLGYLRLKRPPADEPIPLLHDSTGLRVHVGHLRKPPKRRVWRKLHLAVNADTGEVLASDLTNRRTADCARVPEFLDQIDDRVATFMADGAYDTGAAYEAAEEKGEGQRVTVLIPPGRGTQPSSSRSPGQRERNRNIRSMRIGAERSRPRITRFGRGARTWFGKIFLRFAGIPASWFISEDRDTGRRPFRGNPWESMWEHLASLGSRSDPRKRQGCEMASPFSHPWNSAEGPRRLPSSFLTPSPGAKRAGRGPVAAWPS